jgi:hypothetical protein
MHARGIPFARRRAVHWSAVEAELTAVDGLIASSLVRSRSGGAPPGFAEKLEGISLEVARVRDAAKKPDERLAIFDAALRQLEGLVAEGPPDAARALTADALRVLDGVREPLVDALAELEAAPSVEDSFLEVSLDMPGLYRLGVSPLRVSSRARGRYREGSRLHLGIGDRQRAGGRSPLAPLARDAMEDVASLGSLRRLADDEPAGRATSFEARLLANLDYLAALGRGTESVDVVTELSSYLNESVFSDPGRVFAIALAHACIEGPSGLPGLARLVMGANDRTERALVDALSLGSNPRIDDLLAELVLEDTANVLAVALAAQARRGRAPRSVLSLVEHPSEHLAELAAKAAAFVDDQATVASTLAQHLDGPPKVAAACIATLATFGAQIAVRESRSIAERVAKGEISDVRADAAIAVLALGARKEDSALVARAAPRTRRGIAWLGWLGDAAYFDTILAELDVAFASFGQSADDLVLSSGFSAIARLLSRDSLEALVREPAKAKQLLEELPSGRVRRGEKWSRDAINAELRDDRALQSDRRILVLEASIADKRPLRFDPDGWLRRERRKLAGSS